MPGSVVWISMTRPVVAIVCDRITLFGHDAHAAFHGYVHAVAEVSGALPLLLPASGPDLDLDSLLSAVDGLLLTVFAAFGLHTALWLGRGLKDRGRRSPHDGDEPGGR